MAHRVCDMAHRVCDMAHRVCDKPHSYGRERLFLQCIFINVQTYNVGD